MSVRDLIRERAVEDALAEREEKEPEQDPRKRFRELASKALDIYESALNGTLAKGTSTAQIKAAGDILKRSGVMDDKAPDQKVVKIRFTRPKVTVSGDIVDE